MATISEAHFGGYLAKTGFKVPPADLYRAAAQIAINDVLDRMLRLSVHGIGFGRPQRNRDSTKETSRQISAKFVERRQECQGLHAAEEFLLALALLGHEAINLEFSVDVRFVAHNRLKSDIAPCPKSADFVAEVG